MSTPRKATAASVNEELILLIKELTKNQAEVLKTAMEAQKAQSEVLAKWISMFTPQSSDPHKSTSEDDRIRMREDLEAEWDPLNGTDPMFPTF